jgi:hypothetical protein
MINENGDWIGENKLGRSWMYLRELYQVGVNYPENESTI